VYELIIAAAIVCSNHGVYSTVVVERQKDCLAKTILCIEKKRKGLASPPVNKLIIECLREN
jgi:hypothetical protein